MLYSVSSTDALAATVLCSLLGHVVFNRLEPRMPVLIMLLLLGVPALPSLAFMSQYGSLWRSIRISYFVYLFFLSISLVLYRLSPLHPLAKYPGPTVNKISKFWMAWKISQGKRHIYYQELHQRYGTHVRTGPNDLSILEVDAIVPVLGINGFFRGPFYDATKGPWTGESVNTTRDPEEHARRRRVWNLAFTTSALKDYEESIIRRTMQLAVSLTCSKPVDLAAWLGYYTFDFMGDLAFGGGFEMIHNGGDADGLWKMLDRLMRYGSILGAVPWASRFFALFPMNEEFLRLYRFAEMRMNIRRNAGVTSKDVLYHLLDGDVVKEYPLTDLDLAAECALVIVAGADTTSSVMSNLFYYLLSHPEYFSRLQAEVDARFSEGDIPTNTTELATMEFLNAAINETLRLRPAVLNGVERCPPPRSGGKVVAGSFIPEGTNVTIPIYSLHRDPRYFWPLPGTFWPDRWLLADHVPGKCDSPMSEKKIIHERKAFMPFSFGPTGCVGKQLAYNEMRLVVAMLIHKFNMRFADGYDSKQWEDDLRDHHVCAHGKLPVVLTPRF